LLGFSTENDDTDDTDDTVAIERFPGSAADGTNVGEIPAFDPARRWMRPSGAPTEAGDAEAGVAEAGVAETNDAGTAISASGESPSTGQDHRQRGLLFEPEAWENPGVPPS
jgi:hypothetical protein